MNIIRLTIEQIVTDWSNIRLGIIEALFPTAIPDGRVLQNFLYRLLMESMQCWAIYNDKGIIYGHVVTSIEDEEISKHLLICSTFLFSNLATVEDYFKIAENIESFAKANNCGKVTAYANNPNAISIAEKLGYQSEYVVLTKEV